MKKILITGATGNVGTEVVRYLQYFADKVETILAVRKLEKGANSSPSSVSTRLFDFEDQSTFSTAFAGIDILFLLRPPHISDVEEIFRPLLEVAKSSGIEKVVFLSVQGVQHSSIIPHHKIELLIKSMDFQFVFVRPSYFMQNLTTALLPEISKNKTISLPSAIAKFNWVDVQNIGEAIAILIVDLTQHSNKAYEITGLENKNFAEVAAALSDVIGVEVVYRRINPIAFYFKKRREGLQRPFALVMTILHFLPRFQKEPRISSAYTDLTGKEPTSIRAFLEREKSAFLP